MMYDDGRDWQATGTVAPRRLDRRLDGDPSVSHYY